MTGEQAGPVLVTGSSTGIGRAIVEFLSAGGHPVLAGARKESDLEALGKLSKVTPVRLDVTRLEDVARVADAIRDSNLGLYGLVNNAGIGTMGPLAETSVEELHQVLAVNLEGLHRMVGGMFPFLRESRGRIINISSTSGFLIDALFGAYTISKHAVEAYTDNLREEVAPLGIRVSAIEPGNFQSRIWANGLALMGDQFRSGWEKSDSVYRTQVLQTLDYLSSPEVLNRTSDPKPTPVAEAVTHALFAEDPKPRYLVCTKEETDSVVDAMLTVLRQLNEQHPHSLSASELMARLQAVLD
ncbi:MAG: SDR family NAD(P)-dependent oxidoreductase [Thermoplasmata archaeon]|jgi:NAD(P)-dependent dehydrogenase (short-subunit alcohol dehydrogenase family)